VAVAVLQTEKARNWFRRAVLLDPDVGDFWALLYNFEAAAKPTTADAVDDRDKRIAEVVRQCAAAQVTPLLKPLWSPAGEQGSILAQHVDNACDSFPAFRACCITTMHSPWLRWLTILCCSKTAWQGCGMPPNLLCVMAQPRHGERWQRVAKRLENAHKSTEAVLKLVAVDILAEAPP